MDIMENFFQDNGRKNLIFFYHESDSTDTKSSMAGSHYPVRNVARMFRSRVQVVESADVPLKGICVFFVRNSTSVTITNQNVSLVLEYLTFK